MLGLLKQNYWFYKNKQTLLAKLKLPEYKFFSQYVQQEKKRVLTLIKQPDASKNKTKARFIYR